MNKSYSKLKLWFDRLLSKGLLKQFLFLGCVLVVLFLLSWLGLQWSGCNWRDFAQDSDVPDWLLPIYLLIDSNAFNNLYINGVHGMALLCSSITYILGVVVFNGAIIAIIINFIEQRVKNHREGHIHYLKSGHYVVMGYDDMVSSIITHIFERDREAYVLLLSAAESDYIREKLKRIFDEKQLKRIIVNYGHRMSKDYYKDIHLEAAEQIFIVGMRSLPAHDAINVECVDSICSYLQQKDIRTKPKRIFCVFENLDTYAAFKTTEIFGRVKDLDIEFVPYNFYAGWAKQVFVKRFHKDMDFPEKKIYYPAVYGKGIVPEDQKYVHLVFVGTTNFAVAFAMEAANVLHFPNFNRDQRLKTLITFIDVNAEKEKDEFVTRYRHFFEIQPYKYSDLTGKLEDESKDTRDELVSFEGEDANFLDVEFEFIKGDVFSKKVQDVIKDWAQDRDNQYLSIFLALSDQRRNFAFGMNMPDEVYDNEIPVFIRQDRSDNFVSNLRETDEGIRKDQEKNTYSIVRDGQLEQRILGGRYAHIYPFGMNETAFSADEKTLKCAKLIHYLYETADYKQSRFQGLSALDALPKEQIWEKADDFWSKLSVALKWSNLYNAYMISVKQDTLRAMRGLGQHDTSCDTKPLTEEEVEIMARVEHNRWNVEKLLMGYRKPKREEDKYAEENESFKSELKKNKKRFIHHDIRPYEQLDGVEDLDKEFSRYIPWILKMIKD